MRSAGCIRCEILLSLLAMLVCVSSLLPSSASLPEPMEQESEQPLVLPVAHVSQKYAASAQKILDSFYCIKDVPGYLFEKDYGGRQIGSGRFLKEDASFSLYRDYCYETYSIDQYFLGARDAGKMMRQGKTLPEVMEISEQEAQKFYGHTRSIGLLYGDEQVVGEACYWSHGQGEEWEEGVSPATMWEWHDGPYQSLYLDDHLMGLLEAEGFQLDQVTAKSVLIMAHSAGIYFSDGITERYYPQGLDPGSNSPLFMTVYTMCPISKLAESLENYAWLGSRK